MVFMVDSIALAREVFAAFQRGYDKYAARPGVWWALNLFARDADDVYLNLSDKEIGLGVRVLKQKGLIEAFTGKSYRLTELGEECCLHPELLDEHLAPRHAASMGIAPSLTISGGNVQIGDHNTQTITYRAVLEEALEAVDKRDDVPASIAAALRKLIDYPDLEDLLASAATQVGERS